MNYGWTASECYYERLSDGGALAWAVEMVSGPGWHCWDPAGRPSPRQGCRGVDGARLSSRALQVYPEDNATCGEQRRRTRSAGACAEESHETLLWARQRATDQLSACGEYLGPYAVQPMCQALASRAQPGLRWARVIYCIRRHIGAFHRVRYAARSELVYVKYQNPYVNSTVEIPTNNMWLHDDWTWCDEVREEFELVCEFLPTYQTLIPPTRANRVICKTWNWNEAQIAGVLMGPYLDRGSVWYNVF